jgi:hypothetical protein
VAVKRDANYFLRAKVAVLQAQVSGLEYELHMRELRLVEKDKRIAILEQQVLELKKQAMDQPEQPGVENDGGSAGLPPFVKANVKRRRRKTPGRKRGHAAALRPLPAKIDRHQDVPLPEDQKRRPLCPACRCRLQRLRRLRRIVEDLMPGAVQSTCYHTQSGYCPHCCKRMESRAAEQPPAANLPHGQLGINALATAAILRIRHRLPFRQIARLLKDMPGLSISPGGLVKQIKRLARWLDEKYRDLIAQMRASEHVHADETGWRIDGKNFWLWAFTDPTFTLFHVDQSRGGKVPLKLLGKAFGGTVVCDFYPAYNALSGPKQRCLTHLIREVKQTAEADKDFADCPLSRKLLRWCQQALRLKKQQDRMDQTEYQHKTDRLEKQVDLLIASNPQHPDARRLCRRLGRHRRELTVFLRDKKLDGTNNAAERALRPAVIMRKITGGSRSKQAAIAWAKLASLLQTADQRKLGVYEATKKLIVEYWASGRR